MSSEDLASNSNPHPRRLTNEQKNEILAKRLAGQPVKDIAVEYSCDTATVWRICKDVQQAFEQVHSDWRNAHFVLADAAIQKGLADSKDTYKAMEGGIKVFKGLGLYAADQQNYVGVLVGGMPDDIKNELGAGATYEFPRDENEK